MMLTGIRIFLVILKIEWMLVKMDKIGDSGI